MNRPLVVALIILLQVLSHVACTAACAGWQEIGARMGIQAGPRKEYFHQYDVFAVYGLPDVWRSSSGWGMAPRLITTAGALVGGNETGFIGSGGGGLVFNTPAHGIELGADINFNLLDRRHFGRHDYGSILLFGANIGLTYRFDNGLGIGYRIQHLSNGHIMYPAGTPNPGVDMHQIGVSMKF